MEVPPNAILDGLRAMGLLRPQALARGLPLAGSQSSDIWHVTLPDQRDVCIKRALARMRTALEWRVPPERGLYEARWIARASEAVPGSAPLLLGHDPGSGCLAMQWLPPETHPNWRETLHAGETDAAFAAELGRRLARIHSSTARRPALAAEFPTDAIFRAIRLEPYLETTAAVHPDLAPILEQLAERTAGTRRALVHGDVCPANVLAGPAGPVLVDAECAWWGDPAFDLAFCLTHLLLKCLWTPRAAVGFLGAYEALAAAYLVSVEWEAPATVEARAANLLPALLLARVDGKDPVPYLSQDRDRDLVRRVARRLLLAPPDRLRPIRMAWEEEIDA